MVMVLIPFSKAGNGAVERRRREEESLWPGFMGIGEREKTGSGIEWRKEIERGRGKKMASDSIQNV